MLVLKLPKFEITKFIRFTYFLKNKYKIPIISYGTLTNKSHKFFLYLSTNKKTAKFLLRGLNFLCIYTKDIL